MNLLEDVSQKIREARSLRYLCQSVARIALPKEKVAKCIRQGFNQSDVEVWKHGDTKKSFFTGLIVCGRVWQCPVCAAKISERRREELKRAYDQHLGNGGKVALLTLTFSHKITDRLKETLKKFSQASSSLRSGKRWDSIRNRMGMIGSIRAFEITYGQNGFHPHIHIILFYEKIVDLGWIQVEMRQLWRSACLKAGLTVKDQYGLTLEDGEKADEYMAKHGTWGLDREMTKSHIKKGKQNSITPFDFLRLSLENEDQDYISLFQEYAEALKGKTQLQWSAGMKKRFLIEEKTDEEVAQEKKEEADLLGVIDYWTWKRILKYEKRSYILDLCEQEDGFEKAMKYIHDKMREDQEESMKLKDLNKKHKGKKRTFQSTNVVGLVN